MDKWVREINWSRNSYSVEGFWEMVGDKLPQISIVTEGHFGITEALTISISQVIRIHEIQSQERVLGFNSERNEYLSIPVSYPFLFQVLEKGEGSAGTPLLLDRIVQNQNVPYIIQMIPLRSPYGLYSCNSNLPLTKLGKIEIIDKYQQQNLIGNCINEDRLEKGITLIPFYIGLTLSISNGFVDEDEDVWNSFNAELDALVNKIDYSKALSQTTIFVYSSTTICDAEDLNLTEPSDYIEVKSPKGDLTYLSNPRMAQRMEDMENRSLPPLPTSKRLASYVLPPPRPDPRTKPNIRKKLTPRIFTKKKEEIKENAPEKVAGSECCLPEKDWSRLSLDEMSIEDISRVLKQLHLVKYIHVFEKERIDGNLLKELDIRMLREEFKFSNIEAIRLMKFVHSGHVPK